MTDGGEMPDLLTKPLIEWSMLDSITFLSVVGIVVFFSLSMTEIRKRRK